MAVSLGIPPSEFWRMTPLEFDVVRVFNRPPAEESDLPTAEETEELMRMHPDV